MRLRRHVLAPIAAAALCLAFTALPAAARLLIEIDKSTQRMTVVRDGAPLYRWPVSTGARGYATPSGSFTPFRMEKDHFSREWDDAPMPHSIFFTKVGHAIHGTEHLSDDRPAGLAWLRAARTEECAPAVRPGEAGRHGQHPRGADRRDAGRGGAGGGAAHAAIR